MSVGLKFSSCNSFAVVRRSFKFWFSTWHASIPCSHKDNRLLGVNCTIIQMNEFRENSPCGVVSIRHGESVEERTRVRDTHDREATLATVLSRKASDS